MCSEETDSRRFRQIEKERQGSRANSSMLLQQEQQLLQREQQLLQRGSRLLQPEQQLLQREFREETNKRQSSGVYRQMHQTK